MSYEVVEYPAYSREREGDAPLLPLGTKILPRSTRWNGQRGFCLELISEREWRVSKVPCKKN